MKVTVCQIDPRASELGQYMAGLTDHVASNASDFVLLPEMPFCEWLAADKAPDPSRWLAAVESHDRHIGNLDRIGVKAVVGTRPIINDQGSRRNEAFIWHRESRSAIGFHEKYYLPDEEGYWEASWYERGAGTFDTVSFADSVIGVQICTEMWFLEWARRYAASSVDILCTPRATPHGSTDKWLAGGRTAAVCAGAYGLSSSLWYPPGSGLDCGGFAWVVDPEGNVLTTTKPDDPFQTVEIDLGFSGASKSTYPRYVSE